MLSLNQRLHELFDYVDGNLIRKVSVKGYSVGHQIGRITDKGYIVATVDRKNYRLHHLVWLFHHGYFEKELDHINRDRSDNRIENLRPCNHSQNLGNARARVHEYKGVTFCKPTGKWRAQLNGHLGRFLTIEEAAKAYNDAAIKHYGDFAYLNEVD
jgi:hypothetical protein